MSVVLNDAACGVTVAGVSSNFTSSGSGAVSRSGSSKMGDFVSVKDFGALGDGSTDDTTAITNADTYARSVGAMLWFPAGTYLVSQLVLQTESHWQGQGRNNTIIKLKNGSNTDLIYGVNSNANWGSGAPSGFANGVTLRSLTLDGNRANNTSGSCFAFYGPRPILEDVFIKNAPEYGMRTEYTDAAQGLDTFAMEGWFCNVRIDTCGKHGWWNNGPHDSVDVNVIIIDAGQTTTNTYNGFHFDTKSNGRHIGCHAWSRAASNRMRAALEVLSNDFSHDFSGGCNFEGAFTANVILSGQNCLFDPSTRYYAAWNGVNIILGNSSACTQNTIMGKIGDPGSGRPACVGVQFGNAVSDWVANNVIDLHMQTQEAGAFNFTANYGGGSNRIRAKVFNTTTASITNVPLTSDDVDIMLVNSNGTAHINNKLQSTTISIGASTTAVWTFPYAFNAAPHVTFSPASPSAAITSGIWISAISATSVTINNNNAVTATIHLHARATN